MALDDQLDRQHQVLGELRRARRSTAKWGDGQRAELDRKRLSALEDAGTDLTKALKKAAEGLDRAERLLRAR